MGSPLASPRRRDGSLVTPCIEAEKGSPHDFGYRVSFVWVGGRNYMVYAHRAAYESEYGPIPPGMVVRHKCDNPPCVNPEHLEVGTQADNAKDMSVRGRVRNQHSGKSHCIRGHEFDTENTRIVANGRECRACSKERARLVYLCRKEGIPA